MKRILVITMLAVLLLATAGATTAIAAKDKTVVTTNVYQSSAGVIYDIHLPPVGKATFNTETGAWTITTTKPLQPAAGDLYSVYLTGSRLIKGDQLNPNTDNIDFPIVYADTNGNVVASDTYTGDLAAVNTALANGGVFVLNPNTT